MKKKFEYLTKTHPVTFVAILVTFCMSIATLFLNWQLAVGEFALSLVLFFVSLFKASDELRAMQNAVDVLNKSLTADEKNHLSDFPLPVLLFDSTDKVIWYNHLFSKEILSDANENCAEVLAFTNGLGLQELREKQSFKAHIGEKDYLVYLGLLEQNEDVLYALYYLDITKMQTKLRAYAAARPAVALVAIDSLDEFYHVYTESEYAEISSAVERLTETWFSNFSGVFRKLASGRFLAVIPESELQKMIDSKFNILEQVRTYTYKGSTIGITLSGGVGKGESLSDAESAARQALDMALGRGGDQVALKDNEQYIFFGGVSKGMEKRTKVRTRVVASAIAELINSSRNVILMGHKFSDLDAIGSCIGMYTAAKKLGKPAKIAVNRKSSLAVELIDYMEANGEDCFVSPQEAERLMDENTLLIITDTHKPSFLDAPELYEKANRVVVIDHHRKTVDHINDAVIFYHEPHSSSACEMVTEILQYIHKKPVVDAACANALLAGISLDTKDFVLRTGVRTFEAAAYLRSRGADTVTVKQFFANTMESRKQRGQVVMAAELYRNCAVSVAEIPEDNIRLVSAQAADELLSVSQVDASFVLFKTGDVSNISARSMGKINVQVIMEQLDGGGHQTMAAAQLPETSIEDAKAKLKAAIDAYFENL